MKQSAVPYSCSSCSYQTIKWLGCCPSCKAWDSFIQPKKEVFSQKGEHTASVILKPMSAIDNQTITDRIKTGIGEWDRVMGDGMMPGSLLVLTGDPGIGKSTLLLQVAAKLAEGNKVFYFSTEESLGQVKGRAHRLHQKNDKLLFSDCSDFMSILSTIEKEKPSIAIIDSLQNCCFSTGNNLSGGVAQLREAAFQLMQLSKQNNITIMVTSHITKEGVIAGPKTLEHIVDAVFYLQAEDQWQTRMLRAVKNRFGTVQEIGFFQMESAGLQEIVDINKQFIDNAVHSPGSSLVSSMEGKRPLLSEIQTLTISSRLTMPQRVISGLDHKSVILIAAILEKYLRVKLSAHDIFVKVSNGLFLKGSSLDLGIALSLLSSYLQKPLPSSCFVLGEIGLTGHIKPVNHVNVFIKEATTFGIKQLITAKKMPSIKNSSSIHVIAIDHIYELLSLFPDT